MKVTHSLLLSVGVHLSVVWALLWGYAPHEQQMLQAGRAGESMAGMHVTSFSAHAVRLLSTNTAASSADEPGTASSTMLGAAVPAVMPALPVNDRALVTAASSDTAATTRPQKPTEKTRETPRPPQDPAPVRAKENADVRKILASPRSETRDAPEPVTGAASPAEPGNRTTAPAPASASAGGQAAPAGESTLGQASQGAGTSQTGTLKALQRRVNYPVRARSMGVEGLVRLRFDVTASGTVTNIRVLSENPDGMFSSDVIKDMARWRYQAGSAVADQTVSVIFRLNGHIEIQN
ncbi:TonB family protein [Dickeya solani]|nr:TonB family protein [Dickeya solani]ANE76202.1 iron siderophore ABC transporter substrate-binding protein [Dickeya solani IPO 2222]AUH08389.1 iron siderophore ABC transporter substrate-binding protein [Dickeya solani D s0432-1]AUH12389.1 iron siderophore ABC transporter substrate-binding protein [Dickeya solani]MBJ2333859.1 TonB family protein [Dickeya solani]MBJ2340154.1 TonB family protein [Dickeya solani]